MYELTTDTIKKCTNHNFTDFEIDVRGRLMDKLNNHPEISKYASEYDKINKMKIPPCCDCTYIN